jgi:hypothetical protein
MTLLDVLIIYLTLGAPVGVYRFLQLPRPISFATWLRTVFAFLFWVPYALAILGDTIPRFVRNPDFVPSYHSDSDIHENVHLLRNEYEASLTGIDRRDLREMLKSFDRYASLYLMFKTESKAENGQREELLAIASHPNVPLGLKCLARRKRIRLLRHLTNARNDLAKAAGRNSFPQGSRRTFNSTVVKIGHVLMDAELMALTDNGHFENFNLHSSGFGNGVAKWKATDQILHEQV